MLVGEIDMTDQSKDEWGPWIEHDGMGCPCVGSYVHVVTVGESRGERNVYGIAGLQGNGSWDWSNAPLFTRVIRYCIRKPRGMAALEAIARDVPDEIPADHPMADFDARLAQDAADWEELNAPEAAQ